jgi:hypothetical protein
MGLLLFYRVSKISLQKNNFVTPEVQAGGGFNSQVPA